MYMCMYMYKAIPKTEQGYILTNRVANLFSFVFGYCKYTYTS